MPHEPRPMPLTGDQVRKRFDEGNPNNWKHWGVVCAVVDDEVIVVRRWIPHRRGHYYQLIDSIEWWVIREHYQHRRGKRTLNVRGE